MNNFNIIKKMGSFKKIELFDFNCQKVCSLKKNLMCFSSDKLIFN